MFKFRAKGPICWEYAQWQPVTHVECADTIISHHIRHTPGLIKSSVLNFHIFFLNCHCCPNQREANTEVMHACHGPSAYKISVYPICNLPWLELVFLVLLPRPYPTKVILSVVPAFSNMFYQTKILQDIIGSVTEP